MCKELKGEIETVIALIVQELSMEVVEVKLKKRGNLTVLDVIADKPTGGITIDECTRVNKEIVKKLDETQILGDNFVVEVSSPGIDRALKTSKDFNRNLGRMVRFHLLEPINNKIEYQGEISEVTDDHITIISKKESITIQLEIISKAVQVI